MPASENVQITLSKQMVVLTNEFANYQGSPVNLMVGDIVEENHHIFDNIDGVRGIAKVHEAPRRVFPDYLEKSRRRSVVRFAIQSATHDIYRKHAEKFKAEALPFPTSWLFRVAFLDGMATAMEAERYIPEPHDPLTLVYEDLE